MVQGSRSRPGVGGRGIKSHVYFLNGFCYLNPLRLNPLRLNPLRLNPLRLNSLRLNPLRLNPLRLNPLRRNPLRLNPLRLNQLFPIIIISGRMGVFCVVACIPCLSAAERESERRGSRSRENNCGAHDQSCYCSLSSPLKSCLARAFALQ